jgi:hypothetical protein
MSSSHRLLDLSIPETVVKEWRNKMLHGAKPSVHDGKMGNARQPLEERKMGVE